MGYKDPAKSREYQREWREKHKETESDRHREWRNKNPEKFRAKSREYYREKHPNCKHRYGVFHHDFETHRQLAINCGIETALEWKMCHKMGLFPDGIYQDPAEAFKRKGPLKNNNTP